jgi:predicted permease
MESDSERAFITEGQRQTTREAELPLSLYYQVTPDYRETMRIPLLRGRFLSNSDTENSERVAVIDTAFAQKYFAGQDPIGKHVSIFDFAPDATQRSWIPFRVVGIVGHMKQVGLSDDGAQPLHAQLYTSMMQEQRGALNDAAQAANVFVRFRPPLTPEAAFQNIRSKLVAGNDQLIVSGNESEEEVVARSIASQRFSLVLLGAFAGLAVLLASIGIYGVLSYLVGQRTPEIGVRMALGAERSDVLRMILREGARLSVLGAAIGIAAALGLVQLMAKMLFGVKPTDPITFAGVALVLCGIALFSCYLPARRAAKVDPMIALRYE